LLIRISLGLHVPLTSQKYNSRPGRRVGVAIGAIRHLLMFAAQVLWAR